MTDFMDFDGTVAAVANLSVTQAVGRVCAVESGVVQISGLAHVGRVGDTLNVHRAHASALAGELIQICGEIVYMLPDGTPEGIALRDKVLLSAPPTISPCSRWIGRIIDPYGNPLDGRPLPQGPTNQPLNASPPPAAKRRPLGKRFSTGFAALNTFLPIVRGQRIGLFAGSGVGKSTLLASLARNISADVVIIAMIGERGREVREFVDNTLGEQGLSRSIIVSATSDQSPLVRRRCASSAMSLAEYFRDQGLSVLLLADSMTRFAEAHREVAVAAGEAPVLRGFPPSTTHQLMSLCERAGAGIDDTGDITAIFTVLVAGSDMDEPIADILRGTLDGHIVLDRSIAERGRYPAINLLRSVSRSLPDAASEKENHLIATARKYLGLYEENATMIKVGLYSRGSSDEIDKAIDLWPELDAFMARLETSDPEQSFTQLELIFRRANVSVN